MSGAPRKKAGADSTYWEINLGNESAQVFAVPGKPAAMTTSCAPPGTKRLPPRSKPWYLRSCQRKARASGRFREGTRLLENCARMPFYGTASDRQGFRGRDGRLRTSPPRVAEFGRPDGRDGPEGGGAKAGFPAMALESSTLAWRNGRWLPVHGSETCEFKKNWRIFSQLLLCLNLRLRQRAFGRRCPDLPDSSVFQFGPLSSGDTSFLVKRQIYPSF